MGAAPCRETLSRGLHLVPPHPSGSGNSSGASRRLDIVLIPLTKEFFPSPDCPLFVQFHKARCDAGVNYYFRQPGNPGDLSKIPATKNSDDKSSNPSREMLYRGVVERVEEMLFDTDEEMRQAHENSMKGEHTGSSSVHQESSGTTGPKKRVLPIMCAVAFRYDPEKLAQIQQGQTVLGSSGRASYLQAVMENGVPLCGSIVNVVGCFGLVPMEVEGTQAVSSASALPSGCVFANSGSSAASTGMPRSLSFPRSHSAATHSPSSSQQTSQSAMRHMSHGAREDVSLVSSRPLPMGTNSTPLKLSPCGSVPSYDPHQRSRSDMRPELLSRTRGRPAPSRGVLSDVNFDRFASLPPPVAAPLAAIVFLTKSAGEQNLGRVAFIAATTYYNQLVEAGVLKRRRKNTSSSSGLSRSNLPPLETFSFSSLITNIPVISFVYEMRCRWEHFGLQSYPSSTPHSRSNSQNLSSPALRRGSASGASDSPDPCMSRESFEMWLTDDSMFHGRIEKELAERLCMNMAMRPEVMSVDARPLPSDQNYWRFRGLVDRNNPPPVPLSDGGDAVVDPLDTYVMGAAVIDGFDEGDVLVYDRDTHLWVADRDIPLDAVVLAAMRPYCKAARLAPPDDPGWVMEEEAAADGGEDQDAVNAPLEENNGSGAVAQRKRRVHVHEGNFYIYRFELNGKVYYHGTVPDFANPNKKKSSQDTVTSSGETVGFEEGDTTGQARVEEDKNQQDKPEKNQNGEGESTTDISSGTTGGFPSIAGALFSLLPRSVEGFQSNCMAYLPSRVRYVAVDMAYRWMGSLFQYAMGYEMDATMPAGIQEGSNPTVPIPYSKGLSTPVVRRASTFVQVGPDTQPVEQHGAQNTEDMCDARPKGFAKRFIDDTMFVWDWRRS
uniref:Uncharacterized protein n=1 Tax=Trypanosoma congolense (strain IL3000) TaxID=1068625 RepID=G0ULM6_TRYCI|nr:conserved hypothetical protein [Trypanosoma congolense IL3000]